MSASILIRTRFSADMLKKLDRSVERARAKLHQKIPRAAVIRAMVKFCVERFELDTLEPHALADLLALDTVRRGKVAGKGGAR